MSWGALGGGVLRPEGQAGTGTRCGPGGPSLEAGVHLLNLASIDNAILLLCLNSSPSILVA